MKQKNKIATVERLISVEPHPNADRLDLVKVLGYQCVTERGLHKEGDLIIYIQPDSVLPDDAEWAESYRKYSPKRIKAAKLRGEFSEGIIVKFDQIPYFLESGFGWSQPGMDVADVLRVTHYEPPIPQDLSAKGFLPFDIPKTDETRWENKVDTLPFGERVDVTLKIDGQSWTAYYNLKTKEFGVAGRTLEFKAETVNNYTAHIEKYDIKNKLISYCEEHQVSLALRGESFGQGIQSRGNNPHSNVEKGLAIFGVYDIMNRRHTRPGDKHYFINVCDELELPKIPVIERDVILTQELIDKYSSGIKNLNGVPFEGVVINHGPYTISEDIVIEKSENNPEKREFTNTKDFKAGSFKVINKPYDSNK